MREAILSAVRSGNIDALRHAYELNELKPDLGSGPVLDPVAHWRQISGDGAGLEILAVLAGILDTGYVTLALGQDAENAEVYVWPYFAEVPLDTLNPAQEVELLRLVPPAAVKQMKAQYLTVLKDICKSLKIDQPPDEILSALGDNSAAQHGILRSQ